MEHRNTETNWRQGGRHSLHFCRNIVATCFDRLVNQTQSTAAPSSSMAPPVEVLS
jgi:hypothetical protein